MPGLNLFELGLNLDAPKSPRNQLKRRKSNEKLMFLQFWANSLLIAFAVSDLRQLGHPGHQLHHLKCQLGHLGRQFGHLWCQLGHLGRQISNLWHQLPNFTGHLGLGLSLGVLKHSSNAPGPVKPSRCAKDATELRVQLHVPCYVGDAVSSNHACYTRDATKLLVLLDVLCNVAV